MYLLAKEYLAEEDVGKSQQHKLVSKYYLSLSNTNQTQSNIKNNNKKTIPTANGGHNVDHSIKSEIVSAAVYNNGSVEKSTDGVQNHTSTTTTNTAAATTSSASTAITTGSIPPKAQRSGGAPGDQQRNRRNNKKTHQPAVVANNSAAINLFTERVQTAKLKKDSLVNGSS